MASLLNPDGDHVLIACTCSALSPLTRLYFCRHCIKLRCQLCVSHEVDSYYCPNCLENMPSAEAKLKKNRCANCFDCPSCGNTLSTRATAVAIPSEDNKTPQAKKVYYLACGFCRWSSRDVSMEDRTVASGGWPDPENPSAKRIGSLVDFYRQLAQKEKVEREKKKMSKRRNYMHLAYTPKRKDRLGMSSLSRRKSSLSYLTAHLGKGKEIDCDEIVFKDPSTATEDVETLPEEFYTKPLHLEKIPHISQRLANPDMQPTGIKSLHTRHKHLLAKRSQRCRECEHNLSKPEFNPSSIKFKIQLGSVYYVPRLRIANVPPLVYDQEVQVTMSLANPVENIVKVTLHPYEEGDDDSEKPDDETQSREEDKENEKNKENKQEENKSEEKQEKSEDEIKEKDKNIKEEKEPSEVEEKDKEQKVKEKPESLVTSALFDRKTERRVDNRCDSRSFIPTAEVVLPTCALALGARDEASEYDDADTTAELFSDDPRVIADRQCNKLWFYIKVTPKKPVGDAKFSLVMQYDYKHSSTALVRGGQEPETRIETQRHTVHINLGAVGGANEG